MLRKTEVLSLLRKDFLYVIMFSGRSPETENKRICQTGRGRLRNLSNGRL